MKTLLNRLGFAYLWNSQEISQLQLNMVMQTIYDQFYQEFYATVNTASKMETFKTISKNFKFERYLTSVDINKHRIALSRLRCSAHKLMIEVDIGILRAILCSMKVIEDEYHFLLVCPIYRELRTKFT